MTKPNARGTAALLTAVEGLVACADIAELAGAAARLSSEAVASAAALVLLRGEGGTYRGGGASIPHDLDAWAEDLLREGSVGGVMGSRNRLAVGVDAREVGFQGIIAVSAPSIEEDEARLALSELGRLVSTCVKQIASRGRDSRALAANQTSFAKGLHDLRTPLNSLRLGMHLLAPGLADQDRAVVDRTHRAIDRMAALVTEMFDSLQKP